MSSHNPQIVFARSVKDKDKQAVEAYMHRLKKAGLPVILSYDHFSKIVDLRSKEIYAISNSPDSYYRDLQVRKHNGGRRDISAPLPMLLHVQRWILSNILENITIHPAAKAYKKRASIKENSKFHRRQRYLFKSDVVDFFGSISGYWVFQYFSELGYTKSVARLLAGICTRSNSLPQGAATSGYLSNIYMKPFDDEVFVFCRERNLRYTRYADDIAISGTDLDFIEIRQKIADELERSGLKVNLVKTRRIGRQARQKLTGVVVNERLSPGRIFLRKLRQDLYYIDRYGVYGHARHCEWESALACLDNIIGRLSHALFLVGSDKDLEEKKGKLIRLREDILA